MTDAPGDITRLLTDDSLDATEKLQCLLPLVYQELRAIAQARLNDERPGHTLSGTALVHELYVKLLGKNEVPWRNRAHFFDAAATALRNLLVDHARAKGALKRGGKLNIDLTAGATVADGTMDVSAYLALDDALSRLRERDERAARVVMLRFFVGLSNAQTAEAIGVSERTVKNDWEFARTWLMKELGAGG